MDFLDAPPDESHVWWYVADVERVVDGDTLVCGPIHLGFGLSRAKQYVRLAGIDTPERGEPGFEEARRFLAERVEGRRVMIYSHRDETGRYKRVIGQVFVDGACVNRELLDAGLAREASYR